MNNQMIQINSTPANAESDRAIDKKLPTQIEIQNWIVDNIAKLVEKEPDRIDITVPFDRYGLDSVSAYELTGNLETWLEREVDPTIMYNYPTIESMTLHLIEELNV